MDLEEFHKNFRLLLQSRIAERFEDKDSPFPSEEVMFAEIVMEHVAEANISDTPTECYWNGTIQNAKLRITGYALSSDETALDLFVTHYFGTDDLKDLRDSDA